MENEYEIEFTVGDHETGICEFVGYASTWDDLKSVLRDLLYHITKITVCASGEILYDMRDGWDIVTDGPSRH